MQFKISTRYSKQKLSKKQEYFLLLNMSNDMRKAKGVEIKYLKLKSKLILDS